MIVMWHWRLDAFNGLTMFIIAFGGMLGICSCVTRTLQISGCTRLVPEVLCTLRHQLCKENMTSLLLFFPTKANLWHKG
jgi:hypothetical protein